MTIKDCVECTHFDGECGHYALSDFEMDEVDHRDPLASDESVALGQQISDWRDGAVDWVDLAASRADIPCLGGEP